MDDIKQAIGARLKEARERSGLKQNVVAKRIGVHNSTLNKYESGQREADNETLLKLASIYNVSEQWILTGKYIINDQTKNDVWEVYSRLPQDKKKLVDDIIKGLMRNDGN